MLVTWAADKVPCLAVCLPKLTIFCQSCAALRQADYILLLPSHCLHTGTVCRSTARHSKPVMIPTSTPSEVSTAEEHEFDSSLDSTPMIAPPARIGKHARHQSTYLTAIYCHVVVTAGQQLQSLWCIEQRTLVYRSGHLECYVGAGSTDSAAVSGV